MNDANPVATGVQKAASSLPESIGGVEIKTILVGGALVAAGLGLLYVTSSGGATPGGKGDGKGNCDALPNWFERMICKGGMGITGGPLPGPPDPTPPEITAADKAKLAPLFSGYTQYSATLNTNINAQNWDKALSDSAWCGVLACSMGTMIAAFGKWEPSEVAAVVGQQYKPFINCTNPATTLKQYTDVVKAAMYKARDKLMNDATVALAQGNLVAARTNAQTALSMQTSFNASYQSFMSDQWFTHHKNLFFSMGIFDAATNGAVKAEGAAEAKQVTIETQQFTQKVTDFLSNQYTERETDEGQLAWYDQNSAYVQTYITKYGSAQEARDYATVMNTPSGIVASRNRQYLDQVNAYINGTAFDQSVAMSAYSSLQSWMLSNTDFSDVPPEFQPAAIKSLLGQILARPASLDVIEADFVHAYDSDFGALLTTYTQKYGAPTANYCAQAAKAGPRDSYQLLQKRIDWLYATAPNGQTNLANLMNGPSATRSFSTPIDQSIANDVIKQPTSDRTRDWLYRVLSNNVTAYERKWDTSKVGQAAVDSIKANWVIKW